MWTIILSGQRHNCEDGEKDEEGHETTHDILLEEGFWDRRKRIPERSTVNQLLAGRSQFWLTYQTTYKD
jgi:hypothetical protein